MLVTRFMSIEEFNKLMSGEKLVNKTDHKKEHGSRTNSVGFCFSGGEEGLYYTAQHLSGIVSFDVCLVADVDDDKFVKGYGEYASHMEMPKTAEEMALSILQMIDELLNPQKTERLVLDEWSTTEYQLSDFNKLGAYVHSAVDPDLKYVSSLNWKEPVHFNGEEMYGKES